MLQRLTHAMSRASGGGYEALDGGGGGDVSGEQSRGRAGAFVDA